MILTRDQIKSVELKTRQVDMPEWGGAVIIRELTAAEVSEGAKVARDNSQDTVIKTVIQATIDENGDRLFDDGDAEWLIEKGFAPLLRMAQEIQELTGIKRDKNPNH